MRVSLERAERAQELRRAEELRKDGKDPQTPGKHASGGTDDQNQGPDQNV